MYSIILARVQFLISIHCPFLGVTSNQLREQSDSSSLYSYWKLVTGYWKLFLWKLFIDKQLGKLIVIAMDDPIAMLVFGRL